METYCIERAMARYVSLHKNCVPILHVGERHYVYSPSVKEKAIDFDESSIVNIISSLSASGKEIDIIEAVDVHGLCVLPDFDLVEEEKTIDY